MKLTDRMKLAKAARELAMECVVGTAPQFGTFRLFLWDVTEPVCALGHLYFRFHGRAVPPIWLHAIGDKILPALEVLVEGNNESTPEDRSSAVVFPLLAVADVLESAP